MSRGLTGGGGGKQGLVIDCITCNGTTEHNVAAHKVGWVRRGAESKAPSRSMHTHTHTQRFARDYLTRCITRPVREGLTRVHDLHARHAPKWSSIVYISTIVYETILPLYI